MTLYNCRHAGDQYRVTKFDNHMNVESSYLCTTDECDCPAGVRPTCRHRQMLPQFIQREHIGDEWFLDFDRGGWVQMGLEWAKPEPEMTEEQSATYNAVEEMIADDGEALQSPGPSASPEPMPPLPEGIVMVSLDEGPEAIYNAIADAVGEPRTGPQEKPKAVFIRRRI